MKDLQFLQDVMQTKAWFKFKAWPGAVNVRNVYGINDVFLIALLHAYLIKEQVFISTFPVSTWHRWRYLIIKPDCSAEFIECGVGRETIYATPDLALKAGILHAMRYHA